MINEQIRDKEVRLIGADGQQLGIMSAREAQKHAVEAGLDLVKIAPTAKPPVCKIVDYGKYRYELARKEKEAKKKQRVGRRWICFGGKSAELSLLAKRDGGLMQKMHQTVYET